MRRRLESWWPSALVVLLLALLPVLAFLQLRWIDALVAGERVRLGNFVATGVDRIAVDLERELSALEEAFRDGLGGSEEEMRRTLRAWRDRGGRPDLVRAALRVDPADVERPRRISLDPAEDFEVVPLEAWPTGAGGWRSATREVFEALAQPRESGGTKMTFRIGLPADPPGALLAGFAGPAGEERLSVLVLLLDRERLRTETLPALVDLHLGRPFGPPVDLVVAHGGEELFRTPAPGDESPGEAAPAPDARRSFGGGEVELTLGARGRELTLRRSGEDGERDRLEVQTEIRSVAGLAGADDDAGDAGDHGGDSARVVLSLPAWDVRAGHGAGWIDAAVARVRRRNLALGLGVLAVLGAATLLLGQAARRARELARRQVEFVAGVTHELRTPLTVIRSAAENLRDDVVRRPEQARRYGELIHGEAARLTDLVEHALTLAGARGQGADSLRAEDVALPELLRRVVDRCDAPSSRPVRLDVAPGTPAARADAHALERAVTNLLANALKYGGTDAAVGIRAARVDPGRVSITVWDEGPGIPADERVRVFEPFFRGRRARDSQAPGSGLGLAVVRDLARDLGGTVTLESADEAGCAFTLTLPAASE